jgi:hypothetical protein
LLEIGCAYGFFLDEAHRAGFEVSGIEPAEAAAAHAGDLGLNVVCGLLSEATLNSFGTLDIIVLLASTICPTRRKPSRCSRTISGRTESSC